MSITLPNIADQIIRNVQGGIRTDETKFSPPYLFDLIHQARSTVIKNRFTKERRIQSVWTQQYIPDFIPELQDSNCIVKFSVPAPIPLDNQTDGFIYIGEINNNCAYRKATSRGEIANYNKHRATRNNKGVVMNGNIKVLYSDGILEVYGNPLLKEIRIDGIFMNPTLIPTYNIHLSEYPIDDASLQEMKIIILKNITNIEARTPSDKTQDKSDNEGMLQRSK